MRIVLLVSLIGIGMSIPLTAIAILDTTKKAAGSFQAALLFGALSGLNMWVILSSL